MKIKDIQLIFHKELDKIYGLEEVKSFFFLLIKSYYEITRLALALDNNLSLTKSEQELIFSALQDLKKEKPIQYILGETEFFALPFKVNESVLIPRPETEELVSWVIEGVKSKIKNIDRPTHILDIGTGSGCIAISLAKNIPGAIVYALDVSQKALKIAKQNSEMNRVDIKYIHLDILNSDTWNQDFKDLKFDIIVSNPPYVRKKEMQQMKANVVQNEPHLALFVEDDNPLLFYKTITEFSVKYLNEKGKLYFEINEYFGEEMIQLLEHYNFNTIESKQDVFDKDRCIKAVK